MENNNLPNPEEQQEEEKKKKGLFGWFFRNNARAKWGTGIGRGGRSLSSGTGLAGKAGQQASLLAGRGGAGLGAGARAGGGFLERLGLGRLFGGGGGGFAQIFGRGGAIAQFLATKAGMAVAGLLLAALAVGAAVYYNSGDGQTVNVASFPGEGFSPSGQSSSYPMPKDNMFGDDSFLNDSVPSAGSQSSSVAGYGSGASGMGADGSASSGEGEEGAASSGNEAVGVGGGASGTSAFGSGSSAGSSASGSASVGGTAAKGSAATGTASGNMVSGGTGAALSSGPMTRYRRTATSGSGARVNGAGGSGASARLALYRSQNQSRVAYASGQVGSIESAAFTAGNAFDNQDDVSEITNIEVATETDVLTNPDITDTGLITENIPGFDTEDIPNVNIKDKTGVAGQVDAIEAEMASNVKEATTTLEEVLGVWESILQADGNATEDYKEGVDKVTKAISKALAALDNAEDLIMAGGMTASGGLDKGAEVTTELIQRLLIVSDYLTTYWLPNAMRLAYPKEKCDNTKVVVTCYDDELNAHTYYDASPTCACYDDWWAYMKTAQIQGGPITTPTTQKPLSFRGSSQCPHHTFSNADRLYFTGYSGQPDCAVAVSNARFPEFPALDNRGPEDIKADEEALKLTGTGCAYKRYMLELDPRRIRREMDSCKLDKLAELATKYQACVDKGQSDDCYGETYTSGSGGTLTAACGQNQNYLTHSEGGKLVNAYLPKPSNYELPDGWWEPTQCNVVPNRVYNEARRPEYATPCPAGKVCKVGGVEVDKIPAYAVDKADLSATIVQDIVTAVADASSGVEEQAVDVLQALDTAKEVQETLSSNQASAGVQETLTSDVDTQLATTRAQSAAESSAAATESATETEVSVEGTDTSTATE
ncbi:MAG: hypothetical protein GX410_08420 [Elusimicrobia bacterium]|nr:hypothetical protein [Elusimicrobiota bacterium]